MFQTNELMLVLAVAITTIPPATIRTMPTITVSGRHHNMYNYYNSIIFSQRKIRNICVKNPRDIVQINEVIKSVIKHETFSK